MPTHTITKYFALLLFAYMIACGNSNATEDNVTTPLSPSPPEIHSGDGTSRINSAGDSALIIKESGWLSFDKTRARVKLSRQEFEGKPGYFYTVFLPGDEFSFDLNCGEPPTVQKNSERCSKFPFGESWRVQEVMIVDFKGVAFCYKVSAFRGHSAAVSLFVFYDMDGDGKFEALDLGGYFDLRIPGRFKE